MLTFESEYPFSETIGYMVQMRQDLLKLLRECAVVEESLSKFSLFSSKRVFRKEELALGLHSYNHFCEFSRS